RHPDARPFLAALAERAVAVHQAGHAGAAAHVAAGARGAVHAVGVARAGAVAHAGARLAGLIAGAVIVRGAGDAAPRLAAVGQGREGGAVRVLGAGEVDAEPLDAVDAPFAIARVPAL